LCARARLRALADGLALPLADGAEDVDDQAAGGRSRVELLADAHQVEAFLEVGIKQQAQVADRAGEPIELGDQKPACAAGLERDERLLEAWALQALCRVPGVDQNLGQVELVELGVGAELGLLGCKAVAVARLLVGAHADVADDLHRCLLVFR